MTDQEFRNRVLQWQPYMQKLAEQLLGDADNASDAVQDAVVSLWEKRKEWDDSADLKSLWGTVVKRRCIDQLRKGKSHSIAADAPAIDESPTADTLLVLKEQHDWMMECLRRLPVGARAAIQMKGIDGLSYGEMATILGTTEAAARAKVAKARKQLWKLYQRRK